MEKNNKLGIVVALFLIIIFLIGKSVIESGHLLFYIICLLLGIAAYFLIGKLGKYYQGRATSLGKEFEKKYPIVVQYSPPKGINPAEAGLLFNCSVEPTDLTSLIYQWKFEKLIDIKTFKGANSKKEHVKLIKLEDMPVTRPLFESEIFDSIFRMGDVKIIEGAFQLRYALMLEDLEYHGIQKGWFVYKSSKKIFKKGESGFLKNIGLETCLYLMLFFVGVFSSIMESLGVSNSVSINLSEFIFILIAIILIGLLIVLLFGKIDGRGNLKFTDKGAELASKVIGYARFIKSCDENKIKLFLRDDPLFVDRTLPYATAFGMETDFLNKISPLKEDRNAKYVRGHKIPSRVGILHFFVDSDDDSLL